ncbi:MAG: sodium:proton antiporter [Actinomycetota bacterium]
MFRVCKKLGGMLGSMNFFRVEKNAALVLLIAAGLGLALANLGGFLVIDAIKSWTPYAMPINLTFEGWIYNFGLPAFFFLVGLELKRELVGGALSPIRRAIVPLLAAILGVCIPALVYVFVTGMNTDAAAGWAIPTATDVTFALAVFVVFGKALPQSARSFLLAYAVIDDVIAVLIVSALFTAGFSLLGLLYVVIALVAYRLVHRSALLQSVRGLWIAWHVLIAFGALYAALSNGFQPTLVGLALGLLISAEHTERVQTALHPWVAFGVLPVFAFMAAGVTLGNVGVAISSTVFVAVLLRPLGKFVGIWLGAELGKRIAGGENQLTTGQIIPVAALGGIGFTVALLVTKYTFTLDPQSENAAILATFAATAISAVIGALLLRGHRSKTANRA